MTKPLECKMCPECGKTPILVVNVPLKAIWAGSGMEIKVKVTEACDQCFERICKLRGSPGQGFYFA